MSGVIFGCHLFPCNTVCRTSQEIVVAATHLMIQTSFIKHEPNIYLYKDKFSRLINLQKLLNNKAIPVPNTFDTCLYDIEYDIDHVCNDVFFYIYTVIQ